MRILSFILALTVSSSHGADQFVQTLVGEWESAPMVVGGRTIKKNEKHVFTATEWKTVRPDATETVDAVVIKTWEVKGSLMGNVRVGGGDFRMFKYVPETKLLIIQPRNVKDEEVWLKKVADNSEEAKKADEAFEKFKSDKPARRLRTIGIEIKLANESRERNQARGVADDRTEKIFQDKIARLEAEAAELRAQGVKELPRSER